MELVNSIIRLQSAYKDLHVTECILCVQGHDPLTFSFLPLSFLIG